MLHRFCRGIPVTAVLLNAFLGLVVFAGGGCGGGGGANGTLSPENQKNVNDELKATEDAKKGTEQKSKPSA